MIDIRTGHVLAVLADMPDRRKPNGQFAKGTHWRSPKAHWDRAWLYREYVDLGRSSAEIAASQGCSDGNILYWLGKHGIGRRDVSAARKLKKWGATGTANPMFGRTGAQNPRYVDGGSPERQRLYAQSKGKAFLRAVYKRDKYRCVRCSGAKKGPRGLHAHHIRPWAGNPELRFDLANVVTVCRSCHGWIHSKRNTEGEFLS